MSRQPAQLSPYRLRFNFPYLIGVLLGVNAIGDAFLLIDGPDCAFLKAQHVWGRHDLRSTLLCPSGDHRVLFSGGDGRRAGQLTALIAALAEVPAAKTVLVSSLPTTSYPRANQSTAPPEKPAIVAVDALAAAEPSRTWLHVPGRSLSSDWLDGYEAVLSALAAELPLSAMPTDPANVGIMGYLFDRNEADHQCNVAELRRLLDRLDLRVVSVWLDGNGREDLCAIGQASTIISLPYGRRAAKTLCQRTGAELLELDLPLGLAGTATWLRAIAAALGRSDRAEALIADELTHAVPRLEPAVSRFILGKRFLLCQDPYLTSALAQFVAELGGTVERAVVPAAAAHGARLTSAQLLPACDVIHEPREDELLRVIESAQSDLCITNSELASLFAGPTVELGFPSNHYHCLADSPFLGFRGTLQLASRLVNAQLRPPPQR